MKEFKNKVAVITGAERGIALRCAKEGMKVVLAGIGMESLAKTAADLEALGAETLKVQTDVRMLKDIENLAQRTLERFGAAHMLVNNAGVGFWNTLWDSSLNDWEWVMGVNFWGVLYGMRTFIPIMMAQQDECHIVTVSSMSGVLYGFFGQSSYSASKQAVVALSESLYFELAQHAPHIKVSVYIPGQVNTDAPTWERNRPEALQNNPITYKDVLGQEDFSQGLRKALDKAMTIEESADILFKGLLDDKLHIGFLGFREQHPYLPGMLIERASNIINERNPII